MNKAFFLFFAGLLVFAGLSSPALAQMSGLIPNGIAYAGSADANTFTSGKAYNVTVQILYNGGPLNSEVRVYFKSNDTSILPVESGTFANTDKDGVANFMVTPNNTGDVKLTAFAMSTNSGVSADMVFHVIEAPAPTVTPSPSPSPTPSASAPAATPTIAPSPTAAPVSPTPSGDANAQATGIITTGIVIAAVIILLMLALRVFKR